MPVEQRARQFADSVACMVRNVLDGLSSAERLEYLDALNGLNNEWQGDDMQAREELGMLFEDREEQVAW